MIYVMSDIHGEYEKYMEMLKKIEFSDEDTLYILGDIVDRGNEPVKILMDMMKRPNVFPTMGNHDLIAQLMLEKLSVNISEENYASKIDFQTMNDILEWIQDGGDSTITAFKNLSNKTRKSVLNYVKKFPLVEITEVNDKIFIMMHAGLGNWKKDKKLKEYTVSELIDTRPDPDIKYFEDDDIYVICGHTPTRNLCSEDKIWQKNNTVFIDCGAVHGGRLGCLCLDTFEEYYV